MSKVEAYRPKQELAGDPKNQYISSAELLLCNSPSRRSQKEKVGISVRGERYLSLLMGIAEMKRIMTKRE